MDLRLDGVGCRASGVWHQYDIRELRPDGLDDAVALSSAAGWNQRIDDWRMLQALVPRSCSAAWSRNHVVGTAS